MKCGQYHVFNRKNHCPRFNNKYRGRNRTKHHLTWWLYLHNTVYKFQPSFTTNNYFQSQFLFYPIFVHDSITIIEEEIELNIIWHDDYICITLSTNFNPHSRQTIIFNHNFYFIQRILSFLFPKKINIFYKSHLMRCRWLIMWCNNVFHKEINIRLI